jgi:hypothetical protein
MDWGTRKVVTSFQISLLWSMQEQERQRETFSLQIQEEFIVKLEVDEGCNDMAR